VQQFSQWADGQDLAFDSSIKGESPETVKAVREALPAVFAKYGVDQKLFHSLYQNNDVVRSAPFQRMLFELGKLHVAQAGIASSRQPRPVPQVVRPGVSSEPLRSENGRFAGLASAFSANPTAEAGAALIAAKRAAARGGR